MALACNTAGFTVRLYVGTRPFTPQGLCPSLFCQGGVCLSLFESNSLASSLASIDRHSYLEPTEPDDQEMDYDNIWEFDCDTGMIQPMSGISTHRTGLDFGARGLGAMATQQRWS